MTWTEIKINDNEKIDKIIGMLNEIDCTVRIGTYDRSYIEHVFSKTHKDPHIYLYEGAVFQIVLIFLDDLVNDTLKLIKCSIKWDFTDESINVLNVLDIMALKTKEFMIQKNKKIWMMPYKYNDIPLAHILEWYNDTIISKYLEYGIKVTKIEKEEYLYWEFEING